LKDKKKIVIIGLVILLSRQYSISKANSFIS
jgi:hypothetical protein